MPPATIQCLDWDSALFGRKMGVLRVDRGTPFDVESAVEEARRDGYRYLICRPAVDDTALIVALGGAAFYLSDQGVTWALDMAAHGLHGAAECQGVVAATAGDIPALQRLIRFMFPDSRFYNDPFFSTDEAERLHQEWIKNAVAGAAADGVLWLPGAGFITLKCRAAVGEIILIGIDKGQRSRGFGRALLVAALTWFHEHGAGRVTVRTQLRNLGASNFYRAHGFTLAGADLTFSRIL